MIKKRDRSEETGVRRKSAKELRSGVGFNYDDEIPTIMVDCEERERERQTGSGNPTRELKIANRWRGFPRAYGRARARATDATGIRRAVDRSNDTGAGQKRVECAGRPDA